MKSSLYKIFTIALCLLAFTNLPAQEIKKFNERILTSTDGTAKVVWIIEANLDSVDLITLPYNYKNGSGFAVDEIKQAEVKIEEKNNAKYLVINSEGLKGRREIKVNFNLSDFLNFEKAEKKEFGNITFKNKFVNTSGALIKNFRSEIILPEGYVVTSVDETTPKASPSKPDSPFEVIGFDKKHGVAIKNTNMKIGENASITFKTKKENKSYIFLAVLLLTGVGYLYFYRDTLKASENGAVKNKQD